MKSQCSYKAKHSLEARRSEGEKMRRKYGERVPVIVELDARSRLLPLDKCKFLVPSELTVGQLYLLVKKRVQLRAEDALFLLVSDTLPPASATLGELYRDHRDEDHFLYVVVADEAVYGHAT